MASSTAVFKALRANDINSLKATLSSYNLAVNVKDQQGRTPLHVACMLGHLEPVKELLRFKPACDAADNSGNVPLHYAAEQGSVAIVTELLSGGPGRRQMLKKKNKAGQTALHIAASQGHLDVVTSLVEAGARNNDTKDATGRLPSELVPADSPHHKELVDLLSGAELGQSQTLSPGRSVSPSLIPAVTSASKAKEKLSLATDTSTTPTPGPNLARRSMTGSPSPAKKAARTAIPRTSNSTSSIPLEAILEVKAPIRPNSAASPCSTNTQAAAAKTPAARTTTTQPAAATTHATRTPSRSNSNNGHNNGTSTPQNTSQMVSEIKQQLQEFQAKAAAAEAVAAQFQLFQAQVEAEAQQQKIELAARAEAAEQRCMELGNLVQSQAQRIDLLESCVASMEEKSGDLKGRQEKCEETAREIRQKEQEQRVSQDAAIRNLAQRLSTMQHSQEATQTAVQQLSADVTQLMTAQATTTATPASKEQVSSSSDNVDLSAQVEELAAQVAGLAARTTVSPADLDTLRARVTKWEALGVQDQMEVLQLRAQQLSSTVSQLNAAHQETAEKLASVLRWQGEHAAMGLAGAGGLRSERNSGSHALTPANTTANSTGGCDASPSPANERLSSVEEAAAAATTQLASLQAEIAKLQEQVGQLVTSHAVANATTVNPPATPPTTPPLGSRRSAHTPSSNPVALQQTVEDLTVEVSQVRRDTATLKALVEDLRQELGTVVGSLKREWTDAVDQAGRRHAEHNAELAQREARVKAMRDAVVAEGDSRALVAALEQRLVSSLAGIDTRLGLLQHKVEVVEYQLQSESEAPPSSVDQPTHSNAMPSGNGSTPRKASGPVAEDRQPTLFNSDNVYTSNTTPRGTGGKGSPSKSLRDMAALSPGRKIAIHVSGPHGSKTLPTAAAVPRLPVHLVNQSEHGNQHQVTDRSADEVHAESTEYGALYASDIPFDQSQHSTPAAATADCGHHAETFQFISVSSNHFGRLDHRGMAMNSDQGVDVSLQQWNISNPIANCPTAGFSNIRFPQTASQEQHVVPVNHSPRQMTTTVLSPRQHRHDINRRSPQSGCTCSLQ